MLAGGRSSEHDVSLASAASPCARASPRPGHEVVRGADRARRALDARRAPAGPAPAGGLLGADVVFPVLHGPFGEDGTVQGLLELLDVPYVGSGVLASALCMDKSLVKDVMAARGAAAGRLRRAWRRRRFREDAPGRSSGPLARAAVFVKPARLGSSVGIAKVDEGQDLVAALEHAFAHDPRVIVEAHSRRPGGRVLGARHTATARGRARRADRPARRRLVRLRGEVPAGRDGAACARGDLRRRRWRACGGSRRRRSGCRGAAGWRASTSSWRATTCCSTRSTRCRGSPRRRSTRSSGTPAACAYPQLVDRLCALAVERHELERRHRF